MEGKVNYKKVWNVVDAAITALGMLESGSDEQSAKAAKDHLHKAIEDGQNFYDFESENENV
jgi:hypothetical protein